MFPEYTINIALQYNPEKKTYERTGSFIRMVSRVSATHSGPNEKIYDQLSINDDHSNMVKFDSRTNQDYTGIRSRVRDCVKEAPNIIRKRLEQVKNRMRL